MTAAAPSLLGFGFPDSPNPRDVFKLWNSDKDFGTLLQRFVLWVLARCDVHLHPFTACHYLYINRSSLLLHDCSPSGRPARFYISSICLRLSSPWTLKSLIACGGCVILWGASLHSHPVAALRSSFPLSLSPRPSAPPSPPNCCLMVQLLRNTLEHRLRDQGYCHGSPSRLNQKKRQKKTKVLQQTILFAMEDCQKHKFECLLQRLLSFKPDPREHCRWSPCCLHILILCSISCTDICNSCLPLQCATYHL